MSKPHWTDETLAQAICEGRDQRLLALKHIAMDKTWQTRALQVVQQQGGSHETAKDIYQESIIILDERIRKNGFAENRGSLLNFFLGIVRFKYMGYKRRKDNQIISIEAASDMVSNKDELTVELEEKEHAHLVNEAIKSLGDKCQKVLQLQKLEYSMQEIAALLELSSAGLAKKQAYDCRKRLRAFFLERPQILEEIGIRLSGSKLNPPN